MTVTIENLYTGNGSTTNYSFTFPYLDEPDIKASLDGVVTTNFRLLNATTVQFVNNTTANTPTAPDNGVAIRIYRETAYTNPKATFYPGSAIRAGDLNDNTLQNLYVNQESNDKVSDAWLRGDQTVISTETWYTTDDAKVASTKAIENRINSQIDTALTGDVVAGSSITIADNTPSAGKITVSVDAASGSATGSMSSSDFTKLQGIESNATADQTNAEIRTAVEAATDSNVFTDADHTKLNGIEASATADQTDAEIKTAYENNSDTNAYTDAEKTKLSGIEASATADQTDAEIRAAVEAASDSNVFTDADHTKLNGIEASATADQTAAEIKTAYESNAQTNPLTDAEKAVIDGVTANTSELNKLDGVTATTTNLNIVSGKTFRASGDGTLSTTSDTEIPSSKVIATHVASAVSNVGGFVTIANEASFPTTANQPANGVIVSISDAAGTVVNGSGVSTTGRTTDGTPATVTINNFPSSLNSETLASGVALLVTSTGSSNTYNYHKILAAETDVKSLSDDINDFNARYRVAGSAPGSNNDDGDLWFDTAANKMKVYNATGSSWDDVASVGQFFINTISSSSGTGGGSATFNGSAYRFTLSNPATGGASQLLVSVNGVVQKPNGGSSQPSEGFAIDGNDIIFSTAPASGSDYFIITQGSSVSIGTPSANSVNSSHIIDGSIVNADVSNSANIASSKLAKPIDLADNEKVRFGTGNDLEIYHDGSNSKITNATGNFIIEASASGVIALKPHTNESGIITRANGASELYHDNSKKFETTSSGAECSGTLNSAVGSTGIALQVERTGTANGKYGFKLLNDSGNDCALYLRDEKADVTRFSISSAGNAAFTGDVDLADDKKIKLGDGDDLQIYHDGSHSFIKDTGTGNLAICGSIVALHASDATENMILCSENGAVELYYDNSKKLETTNTGINVTGSINVNGSPLSVSPSVTANADGAIGAGDAVEMQANGTVKKIQQTVSFLNPPSVAISSTNAGNQGGDSCTHTSLACSPNGYFVSFYKGTSNYPYLEGGSVTSSSEITWNTGSRHTVVSSSINEPIIAHLTGDTFITSYRNVHNNVLVGVATCTKSGDSYSFTTGSYGTVFDKGSEMSISKADDAGNYIFVASKDYNNQNVGSARMAYRSGTSLTWGTVQYGSNSYSRNVGSVEPHVIFDSTNDKIIVLCNAASGSGQLAVYNVGTPSYSTSNPTVTWGTNAQNLKGSDNTNINAGKLDGYFDSTNNRIVAVGRNNNDDERLWALAGTVSGSGASGTITWGALAYVTSDTAPTFHTAFDSDSGRGLIHFVHNDDSNKMKAVGVIVDPSDNSISFTNIVEGTGLASDGSLYQHGMDYDSTNKIIIASERTMASPRLNAAIGIKVANTTSTSSRFLGFNQAAVTNGNSATIDLVGATNEHQSSLTVGSKYYVQPNGTIATTAGSPSIEAGIAVAATKLVVKG